MNLLANNVLKIIIQRKSIRKFIDKKIEDEKIEILKKAVSSSPTFKNNKNYHFIFVKDTNLRKKAIRAITSGIKGKINLWLFGCNAPAFVIAVGNPDNSFKKDDKHFYLLDTSFAMENLVLCACELGLGTCWIGAFNEEEIKKLFDIPKNNRIVAVSPLGYPHNTKIFEDNFLSVYDNTLKKIVHKRRKKLNEILYHNLYGNKIENDFISEIVFEGKKLSSKKSCIIEGLKLRNYNLNFSSRKIEKEKLFLMFEAARLAPSAVNSQIWRYILVDEHNKIEEIVKLCKKHINPKAIIVACAEMWIIRNRGQEQPYFLIDVPISISHLTLMANVMDLCWDLIIDFDERKIKEILNIPKSIEIIGLIPIGYSLSRGVPNIENFQFYNAPLKVK